MRWTGSARQKDSAAKGTWHRSRFEFLGEYADFVIAPDGRQVHVQRSAQTKSRDLEAVLTASVLGTALRLAGVLCLHGNAVVIDGAAIALAGARHVGKSSLTTALLLQGGRLHADDIIALRFNKNDVIAQRGPHRLRLWPDTLNALADGGRLGTAEPVYTFYEEPDSKFVIEVAPAHVSAQVEAGLNSVFVLERTSDRSPSLTRVAPADALPLVAANTYMPWELDRRGRLQEFRLCAELVRQVAVYRLQIPHSLADIGRVAECVREAL